MEGETFLHVFRYGKIGILLIMGQGGSDEQCDP
jgi:hypothetical protein